MSETLIPIGWELLQLGEIAEVLPSNVDKHILKEEKSVFLCNYMDVYYKNAITSSKGLSIGSVKSTEYQKFKLCKGDVLITKDSETPQDIARSCVVSKDFDDIVCGYHVAMIKGKKTKINGFFLKRIFDVPIIQHYFFSLSNGVTRFGLTKPSIEKAKLPLPPLPEQEKIVEVLETWDGYIGELTKAIRLKKKFKKGLAEKLLTGKLRLPGFNGEWTTVKLGEVCKVIMGQSPSSSAYNICEEGLPLIQGNNDIKLRKTVSRIWTSEITKTAEANCIILTVRAPVGCVGISQTKICLGRGVCAIEPINSDKNFIFSFLIYFEPRWKSLEQGSTFSAVNSSDIRNLEFLIPKLIEEQTAIAQILTTADQEIEALEKKKELIEDQKKFLLNNLITGRIRLPEFTA